MSKLKTTCTSQDLAPNLDLCTNTTSTASLNASNMTTANNITLTPNTFSNTATASNYYTIQSTYQPYNISYDYSTFTQLDDSYNIAIYLKEPEIEAMLDAIISRVSGTEDIDKLKNFISHIIYQRRFSEEFLLKYIDYLPDKNTLLQMHRSEIKSGEYPNIALLFEIEKT